MKKKPVPNTILRKERLDRRLSLARAAELAEVSMDTYSRWEYGTQEPRLSSLSLLCEGFECTPEEIGFEHLVRIDSGTAAPTQDHLPKQDDKTKRISQLSIERQSADCGEILSQDLFSLGVMALVTSQQQNGWSIEELHYMIDKEIKNQNNANDGMTRRNALTFLTSVPLAFLNIQETTVNLIPSETLPLFSAGVPACWHLYYNGGNLQEIQRTISAYLHQLEPLAQAGGIAAGLTSQSYQLASMLSMEHEDYSTAIMQANHAIDYGLLSTDPNVHASALLRKAVVLYSQKRYWQMSTILQSAMPLIKKVSPLMRVRVYSELGGALALNRQDDSLRYTQMAIDICPDDVEADPAYSYTFASPCVLYLNQGMTYTSLGQYKNAWQALQNAEKHLDVTSSMRRWELTTHQATTAIALGNLDLSVEKVESAIQLSKMLNSDLWITDIEQIYQQLQGKWKHEQKVKDIGELLWANHH